MREHIQNSLKECFRFSLLRCRESGKLSQEEMAHRLMMATRSYIDLEHGESCCSTVTFVLFLLYLCPDVTTFLKELRQALAASQEAA